MFLYIYITGRSDAKNLALKKKDDEKLCSKTIQGLRTINSTLGYTAMPNGVGSIVVDYLIDEPKDQVNVYTRSLTHSFFAQEPKAEKKPYFTRVMDSLRSMSRRT
jgi:hypothetical protein